MKKVEGQEAREKRGGGAAGEGEERSGGQERRDGQRKEKQEEKGKKVGAADEKNVEMNDQETSPLVRKEDGGMLRQNKVSGLFERPRQISRVNLKKKGKFLHGVPTAFE